MLEEMWIDQRGSEVLSRGECLRRVAMAAEVGTVGHLALSTDGAPVVHPVNFGFDGDVVVRLGEGFMWRTAVGRLVAFEVDVTEDQRLGPEAWSVLVRGLASVADLGELDPAHLPAPLVAAAGDNLLRIRPDTVSGRRFPLRRPVGRPPG